jgi:ATP-dependent Lon protease
METTAFPAPAPADSLQAAATPVELTAAQLRFQVATLPEFRTTAELESGQDFVGQERARTALELGLGIMGSGFHLFVSGLSGTERLETLRRWIVQQVAHRPTPCDWVYVHNFTRPDEPHAISLPAGRGRQFKQLMHELIETLREELPKAFRQEAFDKEKARLKEKYSAQIQARAQEIEAHAREKGLLIQPGPAGHFLLIPVVNGQPLDPEDFMRLSEEERKTIENHQRSIAAELETLTAKQQEIMRTLAEEVRQVERRFGEAVLSPFLATISRALDSPAVDDYLAQVKAHILDHLDDFKEETPPSPPLPIPPFAPARDPFLEYDVNVVVDNAETQGAPVLAETSPTYLNLFGTIERIVDRFGRIVTNFTRIKSGSLLRAHGGYLLFNLEDALTEFGVWKTLKRTLKSGRIEIETYEPFALFATSGLKPEPIAIQTKVIVVGSPLLYHLLYVLDEEFREIFKVHADFRPTLERTAQHLQAYGQWVARLCQQEGLPHFERAAVARLVEFGARRAEDRYKVSASSAEITDLAREAAYWARRDNSQMVTAHHVQTALDNRVFRANRIEEEIRDLITQGTILVDITGRKVGQVNGLSVLQLGDHSFGRPSRVTASVAMGQAGIINVEREARLSGSIHDKGLLILAGYLRNRYGQDKPLTLSASLCFEQSYSGIEGDSASSTELYTLLSRLAGVPVRQDLAVTGSVNQWGEVQAIGGVNEKIEGFFDVCAARGLSGEQAVLIPVANVKHLMLKREVVDAVSAGKFNIYPVASVDEGIEILTGVPAGQRDALGQFPDGTINGRVERRLAGFAERVRAFTGAPGEKPLARRARR